MKKLENKKFEYIDDNPGEYFGMLVESVGDKKEMKEEKSFSRKSKVVSESKKLKEGNNMKVLNEKYIHFPVVVDITDDMSEDDIQDKAAEYFDVDVRTDIDSIDGDTATVYIYGEAKDLFSGAVKFFGNIDQALEVFADYYGEDVYFEVAPINRKFSKFIKDLTAISNKHGVAVNAIGGIDFFIPEIGQKVRYSNDLSSGDITYTIIGPKT